MRWTRTTSPIRIPNLVRDLFAEGAMSSAFVPTFTRHLTTAGQGVRVAARQPRHQRADRHHGRAGRPRDRVRRAAGRGSSPARTASVPGKLELTVFLTRLMLPVPHVRGAGRRVHGHAQLAAPVLHPGAVACDVQRGDDHLCAGARAAHAGARPARRSPPSRSGRSLGGVAQLALQWPGAPARRLQVSPDPRLAATRASGACSC